MENTKLCSCCNTTKTINFFYKDKSKKDGLSSHCKQCIRARTKQSYINNKDEKLSYLKEYTQKNKEKLKEYKKIHYENNKEHIINRVKKYREDNILKVQKRKHLYYINNKERIHEAHKEYLKTEKGSLAKKNVNQRRRANLRKGDVKTDDLIKLVNNTNNCYWCNCKLDKKDYHIDHYIPLSKGGKHTLSNLVVSCPNCNHTKNAKDPYIFAIEKGKLF